ncbi:MAG: AsmA-like C-terminal region-containing protein [Deltaproteobacteria bacterium]|nr:AsmA-like C-terminal region-containing protein [Deltaproteobacteria bacterium]
MKLVIKLVAGLVVLVVIGIAALFVFVKPEKVKAEVLAKINEQINGTLSIEKASLKIFPFIGVHLEGLKVVPSDQSPFKGQPFVTLNGFDFKLDLKGLLYFKIATSLLLDQPEIVYIKRAGGTNLDDLIKKSTVPPGTVAATPTLPTGTTAETKPSPTPSSSGESPFMPKQIWVDAFEIRKANITYRDETVPGDPLQLKDLNLKISSIKLEDPKNPIGVKFRVDVIKGIKLPVELTGKLFVDLKESNVAFKEGRLALNQIPFSLGLSVEDFKVKQKFGFSLESSSVAWKQLAPFAPAIGPLLDGSAGLKLHASGVPTFVHFDGALDLTETVVNSAPSFIKPKGKTLSASLAGETDTKNVTLSDFSLGILSAKISGSGTASLEGDQPISLKLASTPLPLEELKTLLPAYKEVTLTGQPEFKFAAAGPMKHPEQLSASGGLTAPKITYEKYTIADLKSNFEYKNQIMDLQNLSFRIFEGSFIGTAKVNLASAKPNFDLTSKLDNIDVAQAVSTFAAVPTVITGRGNFDMKVRGEGIAAPEIKKSLIGNGSLSMKDGKFTTANLGGGIFSDKLLAITKVPGLGLEGFKVPEFAKGEGTAFRTLATTFTIENGKVHTADMKLDGTDYAVEMNGGFSLDLDLDYKGTFHMNKNGSENWIGNPQLRPLLTDTEGRFTLPFTLTGPMTKPTVLPDVSYVQNIFAKAATEMAKQKAKSMATSIAKEKLKNLPIPGQSGGGEAAKPSLPPVPNPKDLFKKLF